MLEVFRRKGKSRLVLKIRHHFTYLPDSLTWTFGKEVRLVQWLQTFFSLMAHLKYHSQKSLVTMNIFQDSRGTEVDNNWKLLQKLSENLSPKYSNFIYNFHFCIDSGSLSLAKQIKILPTLQSDESSVLIIIAYSISHFR